MPLSDKRVLIALMASSCASCVGAPPELNWPRTFEPEITRVAGGSIVDCGFFSLSRHGRTRQRDAALTCMERARREGRAFKYGTVRVPMDSTAWEVFVHTPLQDYLFVQDEMVLEDFVQRWHQRCVKIEVDRRTGIIMAEECSELPALAS